jgi:ferredoxin-NADP reductase
MPTPLPTTQWTDARITRIERRTARLSSVFLEAALAQHVAGQHVDVRLTAPDGYQAQRSYSIASAPGARDLELAIERLDDGEVSPYFHEVAQPGDTIEVRGPFGGHFIWRPEDGGPVLLVAGGSGIAPLMAIARAWSIAAAATPLLLFYSARTWDDLVYRDELLAMAARTAAFAFVAATTRGPRQRAQDFDRRLDRPMLLEILGRWDAAPAHVYVCGSNAFVGTAADHLVGAGVPARIIRTERYGGTS